MAKIKLGARPKSFKHLLKVQLPGGDEGSVEMVYKYKTRTEFGLFLDEILGAAKQSQPEASDDVSLAEALERTCDQNADYIMQIAEGWNLEDEFNRKNVEQLCDELPGVALAIINAYRVAIAEGRLGN